jgi:DNA polymerase-3 subunit alpha
MALHEQKFVAGAVERAIKKEKAQQIFSLMAQFADYGFNRSHSVAYAYLAFQTAYLKAHYPEHFYAAVLSNETQDTSKVFKYSTELRGQGILLLSPDVNESGSGFTPLTGAIRYGLAAVKGIGQQSVNAIIEARAGGKFSSPFDFTSRVSPAAINKRVMESLVCAGAFDSLNRQEQTMHLWRSRLHHAIDAAIAHGTRLQRDRSHGQNDLFGGSAETGTAAQTAPEWLPDVKAWTHSELLAAEKNAIGFYITGHPLDNYQEVLAELCAVNFVNLAAHGTGAKVNVGGMISSFQVRTTKKGARFALMRLEDQSGGIKCVAWPEVFNRFERLLRDDLAVLVHGGLEVAEDGGTTIFVEDLTPLDDVIQRKAKAVIVALPEESERDPLLEKLFRLFDLHKGDCEVLLDLYLEGNVLVRVRPHTTLRVRGSHELEEAIRGYGCRVEWANVTLES